MIEDCHIHVVFFSVYEYRIKFWTGNLYFIDFLYEFNKYERGSLNLQPGERYA